jgi:nucleoside 2-deoxyribosyltransferase
MVAKKLEPKARLYVGCALTEAHVYNWDIGHCVRNCDAIIGICDYPSIGLGYELGEAVRLKKPVLAIAHEDSRVTRLILGAAEVEPNFRFERYKNINKDILKLVNHWLAASLK